jgi:hypothetical protein
MSASEETGLTEIRQPDGWIILKDGERELIRFKLPSGGVTKEDVARFVAALEREARLRMLRLVPDE